MDPICTDEALPASFGTKGRLDENDLLSRAETAAALTAAGYRIKETTLATKACRGDGPPYRVVNRRALYRWSDALDWARGETTDGISHNPNYRMWHRVWCHESFKSPASIKRATLAMNRHGRAILLKKLTQHSKLEQLTFCGTQVSSVARGG
jgi:hypothetical protein